MKRQGKFPHLCASRKLHENCGISGDGKAVHNKYVRKALKEKLLILSEQSSKHESELYFCEDCINEVQIHFPHLEAPPPKERAEHPYTKKQNQAENRLLEETLRNIENLNSDERAIVAHHIAQLEAYSVKICLAVMIWKRFCSSLIR